MTEDEMAKGLELLQRMDPWHGIREALKHIGAKESSWAGIPLPMGHTKLVVEPRFPRAAELMKIFDEPEKEVDPEVRGAKCINRWYCRRHRIHVAIWALADGRRVKMVDPGHHLGMEMNTVDASVAWGLEQEHNALNLLGELIPHHMFKAYILTGMFIETSKRSGVTYFFRKLRPTIAARAGGNILAALCLHPIAYYQGSWAGAMVPTDDIIAHLMLMRGDEVMFWRRANQHPHHRPEAGL